MQADDAVKSVQISREGLLVIEQSTASSLHRLSKSSAERVVEFKVSQRSTHHCYCIHWLLYGDLSCVAIRVLER